MSLALHESDRLDEDAKLAFSEELHQWSGC